VNVFEKVFESEDISGQCEGVQMLCTDGILT
jgi:hypothetical protein